MKFRSILPIAVAAGLGLTACHSVNTVQNAETGAVRHTVADARVTWDNTLNGKLIIGQIIEGKAAGDLRRIQVNVANNYAYALDFMYAVEWYDRNGMKVPGPTSGWKRLHLEAHESSEISAIAVSPDCYDFKLKFQEGKGHGGIF